MSYEFTVEISYSHGMHKAFILVSDRPDKRSNRILPTTNPPELTLATATRTTFACTATELEDKITEIINGALLLHEKREHLYTRMPDTRRWVYNSFQISVFYRIENNKCTATVMCTACPTCYLPLVVTQNTTIGRKSVTVNGKDWAEVGNLVSEVEHRTRLKIDALTGGTYGKPT
jgi:hypothetical protein